MRFCLATIAIAAVALAYGVKRTLPPSRPVTSQGVPDLGPPWDPKEEILTVFVLGVWGLIAAIGYREGGAVRLTHQRDT